MLRPSPVPRAKRAVCAALALSFGAVAQPVDPAGFTAWSVGSQVSDPAHPHRRLALGEPAPWKGTDAAVLVREGDVVVLQPRGPLPAAEVNAATAQVRIPPGGRVEVTGRGIEGIRMEVKARRSVTLDLRRLGADAVTVFASQLKHSAVVQAASVSTANGKVELQAPALSEPAETQLAQVEGTPPRIVAPDDRLVLRLAALLEPRSAGPAGSLPEGEGEGVQLRVAVALGGAGALVAQAARSITR